MYPDSSYAAFYQHSKAFLGHVKNLLERRRFGGTGPRLDQVFCRVGKMPPLQAQGWHSPLHVAWSIFASARPPYSSNWTQAICALPRSAQLTAAQLRHGVQLFFWSVRGNRRGKGFRSHKSCDVTKSLPHRIHYRMPLKQSLFLCHSLLPRHRLPPFR